MFILKNQMMRLLGISMLSSIQISGAAWVALLYARGFSMAEIGIAEGVFHIASLLFEIPSGVISDVFGRKRSMALSQLTSIISSLLMAFSRSFAGVCLSLVFSAFSYNFASGAREALAYDSLKSKGQERHYLRYSSVEMTVYRVCSALATLLVGFTLYLGYRRANLLDAVLALAALVLALRLREIMPEQALRKGSIKTRIRQCFAEAFAFFRREGYARRIMLVNALSGAVSILIAFFMQARLPLAGLPGAYLGPALFVIGLGGVLGARLAVGFAKTGYRRLVLLSLCGTALGLLLVLSDVPLLMCLGGFFAAAMDDLLQIRTDAKLNDMFPSAQRATLVSVSSLCFSVVMVVLSPLAGLLFGQV
ncbi:MAG: MFS transporter [Clostridia bacterium]|nr:MFS transporter [Clostridia bacterium]